MDTVDGLPLGQLHMRVSAKWREFPADVLPLPVAEMDFEIALPIRELLTGMVARSDTGYLGAVPELAANFSAFAKSRWNWSVESEQIFTCTDVGVGMVEMARTIVSPGDRILVNSPVYHNFYNWIIELKCEMVDAPLVSSENDALHFVLDIDGIEKAYASGVKIHFLCNPHNPTGSLFSREELSQLADLAKKYGVYIFSDEIHAPIVYEKGAFHPFLSISDNAREVGVCVTSASKAWNLAGLKCAMIITGSSRIKALADSMPLSVHWRASLFGAFAAATAYTCTDWLDSALSTLDRNRRYLKTLLNDSLPLVGYRIPDCSYLAWLDVSAHNLGENPAEHFLTQGKVAFNAGSIFGPSGAQFVRLNFATSEAILEEAIFRMAASVR
ncbi:MAG: aminotransferase class I/II-fold pyridoxal phosphate-dependent enzyme [Actinobacteria bacterium]|uniref:cysteine-S-conjugate beta-lyase n=1 Tax=freshwater metagenome TaxID=449393 RepID=A0A6J6H2Y5_9ZZZZ|nr:aminotransferase class I/II-fold pyridoxal phosphate-dependent enzyme [Actinomycetota bacterium]